MKTINFTQEQVTKIFRKYCSKKRWDESGDANST